MKYLLFALYIFLILAVIFGERKSPTEALLWVLVLVCLPYVGVLLYLVFGSTMSIKITAYVRKKRLQESAAGDRKIKSLPMDALPLSQEDREVIRFNTAYNGCVLTSLTDAGFFTDGKSHYAQLLQDIRQAKDCIYAEFYTIHHDQMGRVFAEELTKKAQEGVKVLVMCDFLANVGTPAGQFRPLCRAGGRVIRLKPYLTHYRSHRKIVVIDHRISYIGGMNIGEKYADQDPVKTPWRDTQIRMTGPCCEVLDRYFLIDWLCAVRRRELPGYLAYVNSLGNYEGEPGDQPCQFIVGGADTHKESVKMCYLSMIRSAKHRIRIQTPYFIPDASILDGLKTAAAAGVEIELMIPGIRASFFLDPVTTYYCGQLAEYGAKIHKYRGYVHAKTMIIDQELYCIGSVNMDMRSLMVDDEVCGVFYSNAMVEDYSSRYDQDLQRCTPYTYEEFSERSTKEKIAEGIFLLFAPLM